MGQDSGDNGDGGPQDAVPDDAMPAEAPSQEQRQEQQRGPGPEQERPEQGPEPEDAVPGRGDPRAAAPPPRGRLLNGRYRLGDVVGRGGMGTVWRARDEMLGRSVAVKELRLPPGVDDAERKRLVTRTLREAKAIAAIRSRGVVTIYDVVDESARPWIVMELIEGRSLADIIREDGPMPPERTAAIGLDILAVLRAAHSAGILHRDVKPSNVIVSDEDGRVVLTDFGIAKVEGDPSITSTGMLVGAPSYISPERARGEELGPPADLWSLGALLYCCVEGRPPYDEGGAIATLAAVMHDPMRPPQRAGPLTGIVSGLLAKEPSERLDEPAARALLSAVRDGEEEPGGADPADRQTFATGPRRSRGTPPPPSRTPSPGRTAGGPAAEPTPESTPRAPVRFARNEPPVPPGAPPRGPLGGTRGRVLLVVAVGLLLAAVLGTAFALTRDGTDDSGSGQESGQAGGTADGEQQAPGQGHGQEQDASGQEADGGEPRESPGTAEPAGPPARSSGPPGISPENDTGGTLPESPSGFSRVLDEDFRFRITLPDGWQRTGIAGRNSGGIYSAPGGEPPKVQIDFNGSPQQDAEAAWRSLEPAVAQSSTGYRLLGIETVEYRGYPTVADWQFERVEQGRTVRVLNRGFRVDDERGYAIMITCVADAWNGDGCRAVRETAFDTFRPLD